MADMGVKCSVFENAGTKSVKDDGQKIRRL
jgi:hypothetical protein